MKDPTDLSFGVLNVDERQHDLSDDAPWTVAALDDQVHVLLAEPSVGRMLGDRLDDLVAAARLKADVVPADILTRLVREHVIDVTGLKHSHGKSRGSTAGPVKADGRCAYKGLKDPAFLRLIRVPDAPLVSLRASTITVELHQPSSERGQRLPA